MTRNTVGSRFDAGAQYIAGVLREGTGEETFDVVNPADGSLVQRVRLASAADVDYCLFLNSYSRILCENWLESYWTAHCRLRCHQAYRSSQSFSATALLWLSSRAAYRSVTGWCRTRSRKLAAALLAGSSSSSRP